MSNNAYVYTPTYSESYTRNGLNQVTAINASSVTHDSNQNTTGVSGNTYGYDAQGRLTSASAGLGSTAFVFDPLGRLHDSTVGGTQTVYTYAGAQLAAEYNSAGVMQRRYVPGLGLDDVVTSYVGSGTGTRSWQLADERGSVVALADTSGGSTQTNAYDEYGTPASGNGGRFQYTGQAWMPEAGTYNYRARAYLPQIGRFLQTDPIRYAAGQNVYAYVGLDPINHSDATGLCNEPGGELCPTNPGDVFVTGRRPTDETCRWERGCVGTGLSDVPIIHSTTLNLDSLSVEYGGGGAPLISACQVSRGLKNVSDFFTKLGIGLTIGTGVAFIVPGLEEFGPEGATMAVGAYRLGAAFGVASDVFGLGYSGDDGVTAAEMHAVANRIIDNILPGEGAALSAVKVFLGDKAQEIIDQNLDRPCF